MRVEFENLYYERDGKVARVVLNRPRLLNAMNYPAVCDLDAVSQRLEDDPDIRVVTIEGAGRAFCTGIDLKDLSAGKIDMSYHTPWERALRRFETMEAIVICLIHGYALGGGLQLALASDIRVATPSARLGLPAIKEGLIPGLGTLRLARYIGLGRAKRLILSGDLIDGEEALRIGLVDHLVSEDEEKRAEEFREIVHKYLEVNSEGCRLSKLATYACFDLGFEEFFERYLKLQDRAMSSEDFREAMAAYREDRRPVWK